MLPVHVLGSPRLAEGVRAALADHEVLHLADRDALRAAMPELRVLFAPFPPRDGWGSARELRLIQLLGSGVDQLLPSPDLPPDVAVAGLRGVMAEEVAEHVCLMLLALARHTPALIEQQRSRSFRQRAIPTLAERRVVLLGLGAIGDAVARRLAPFGCALLGVRRTGRPHERVADVITPERLGERLRPGDALVLCLPRTAETVGLVGAEALAAIAPDGLLVDVSRGGLLHEPSALQALHDGQLGGVAKDVFDDEPLPESSPWWDAPRTIVTPHIAGLCEGYRERAIATLVDNMRRLERGQALAGLIDRDAGY